MNKLTQKTEKTQKKVKGISLFEIIVVLLQIFIVLFIFYIMFFQEETLVLLGKLGGAMFIAYLILIGLIDNLEDIIDEKYGKMGKTNQRS